MDPEIWRQHRTRGQEQQRQSRFRLCTRRTVSTQQAEFERGGNWSGKHGGASLRRCRCLGRVLADKNSNGSLVSVYAHVTQSQRNKLNLNEWGIGAGNETRTRDFHLGKVVIGSNFLKYNQ